MLEWVRRPEYRTELLALVLKYERLAAQAEGQSGSDPAPRETPIEETQPAPVNTGRAGPLLDPMGRKDR